MIDKNVVNNINSIAVFLKQRKGVKWLSFNSIKTIIMLTF